MSTTTEQPGRTVLLLLAYLGAAILPVGGLVCGLMLLPRHRTHAVRILVISVVAGAIGAYAASHR